VGGDSVRPSGPDSFFESFLHCALHLLKSTRLNLAHALARHAQLRRQLLKLKRLARKPPREDYFALATVQ
jgi:hypothetical protein